ncbi:DUF309 domain-containing protein [Halarchaeum sp. P4]|uniref:DUF309 domain-containing protein n=1 Tax=Halarchaeum sp. P4 TaxID=3421639 RepID=UPI003EC0910F
MEDALLAGVAAFDAGQYEAASDVWSASTSEADAAGDSDAGLRAALADYASVVADGRADNFDGLADRAKHARESLARLDGHRDVGVAAARDFLATVAADPEVLERRRPPHITVDGERVARSDLDISAVFALAPALAEALGYDAEPVAQGVAYARADLEAGEEGSQFVTLVYDVVTDDEMRPVAYQRLTERVERREAREKDVEGLFG